MMADEFRAAMRQWRTGVCIVTSSGEDGGEPIGLVCNSFTAISLDPPLIGWAVDHNSTSLDAWRRARSYAVHVLPPRDCPLDDPLVATFAKRGGDKFRGLDYTVNEHGDPIFPELATRFDCLLYQRIPIGDHDLMVGQATDITHPSQNRAS